MALVKPHHRLVTPLCARLGCDWPILLAGMGGVARHRLAAAVCRAGGFGVLGMVREPVARIRSEVEQLRAQVSTPFAVNLIPAATPATLLKEQVAVCVALQVPFMVLFWDVDIQLIKHLRDEGIGVIHQVGSRDDAERALEAGAEVLIVQGYEAGGHVRGTVTTLSLLAELAPDSPVPLVASGGIGNGATLAAALMAGAQGVSLGTTFLATEEANAHDYHKRRVIEAGAGDTLHTTQFHVNWPERAPVRVLNNSVTRGERGQADTSARNVIGEQDGQPVYLFSTDSPLADATGAIEDMALYAGQSCGQVTKIISAGERLRQLVNESSMVLNAGSSIAQSR